MVLPNVTSDRSSRDVIRRIIMVGEAIVGKTCLVDRFFRNTFGESSGLTLRDPMDEYVIRNQEYRMRVWDLKGGKCYKRLNQIYYRDVDAVILCYDASELDTYHSLRTYWLAQVREFIPNCRIYVCATKRDLLSRDTQLELLEHYLREGHRIGDKFYLTSAKTGENVHDMFMDIFADLIIPGSQQFEEQKIKETTNQEKNPCTIS